MSSVDFAAERIAHRKLLARANQRAIVGRLTGELLIKLGQRLRAGRIDEQSSDHVQKVVTGGARRPATIAQALGAKKNLLGHDPGIGASRPKRCKYSSGSRKPIGMIDSQSRQASAPRPTSELSL